MLLGRHDMFLLARMKTVIFFYLKGHFGNFARYVEINIVVSWRFRRLIDQPIIHFQGLTLCLCLLV